MARNLTSSVQYGRQSSRHAHMQDVQNFDSSLRRSILIEFGSEADRGGKVAAGIDLPGGGKSRWVTFLVPALTSGSTRLLLMHHCSTLRCLSTLSLHTLWVMSRS